MSSPEGKKSRKISRGVLDYLVTSLPPETLLQLYTEETRGKFVCRVVLQRALSPVAQHIVVRLNSTGGSFPVSGIQVWSKVKPEKIWQELHMWAILNSVNSGDQMVSLTPEFQTGLRACLCCLDASPWQPVTPVQIALIERETGEHVGAVTPEDLERYTQSRWDSVLHFLVGSTGQQEPPSAVVSFLLQTGLMQPDPEFLGAEDEAPLVITEKGYDFMLQDNHQQVWHFVVQYLQSLEAHEKGPRLVQENLLLLICLSFARVGEAYLTSSLSKDGRVMVKDLALFGLLYTKKVGKNITLFYPTRVAMQLMGNDDAHDARGSALWALSSKALDTALAHPTPHDSSHLAIIVQTNFQLCAYTTSELHVNMLGLFCDIGTIRRLPNIVFMSVTRDSVKSAFAMGIQARQILRFLEKHAHPNLRSTGGGGSSVPTNVVDQIWLWDRERVRVQFTEVYQHQCLMPGEYAAVEEFARDRDGSMWSSERRQQIFLDYGQVENVQTFVRQWRAKMAEAAICRS